MSFPLLLLNRYDDLSIRSDSVEVVCVRTMRVACYISLSIFRRYIFGKDNILDLNLIIDVILHIFLGGGHSGIRWHVSGRTNDSYSSELIWLSLCAMTHDKTFIFICLHRNWVQKALIILPNTHTSTNCISRNQQSQQQHFIRRTKSKPRCYFNINHKYIMKKTTARSHTSIYVYVFHWN